jgi:mRNA-degrading endonuclease RelE of RelBE toxin-antitoxin system
MKVRLAPQVVAFVRTLAPEPRRRVRQALRELKKGQGDIKSLDGPLQDYARLRVGPYRVILSFAHSRSVDCVYAERRSIVYEVFADAMIDRLMGGHEST